MHLSGRRLILVALLLAVILAPGVASASQPVPAASPGALGMVTSPGESLARLWAWVATLLPGPPPRQPAPARTLGDKGPTIRPNEGSAPDPNG
jgi:hypothetical protein